MKTKDYIAGSTVYEQELIDSNHYSQCISLLRDFFLARGFVEVPTQARISILAACEDPSTVQTFNFLGNIWPLPQTGQVWLEHELLTHPNLKGVFCISTSYREEKNPIPGRHKLIFPMFEFESHGTVEDLKQLEKDLINYLGLNKDNNIKELSYKEAKDFYGVEEISAQEENKMVKDFSKNVLLTDFPLYTSPFWNMKMNANGETADKVDVIIEGDETIGSAERSSNEKEMRELFYSISDGGYSKLLFDKFGKERVEQELNDYLALDFFPRFGGGIGVTRMISALLKNNIIK